MKFISAIIWLACIYACNGASETKKIEELLSENTKELVETKLIINHIDDTNKQIKAGIEQQQVWLTAIKNVDDLLAKLNKFLDVKSMVVLEALNNVTLKSGLFSERLSKDLFGLAQLQLSTKQQIIGLEQKMEVYQKHVLNNARSIDNNILELTKLITRAVLPQLNGLQCSFDSLETSQINVEVELKSLERIKDISVETNSQLSILSEQLCSLNRTQNSGLSILTSAVRQLNPLSSWHIESALRELIISQKRIELDLEACEKRSSSQYFIQDTSPASYPETYQVQPPTAHPLPHLHNQGNLVQSWNTKQSNQQSANSGSSYASAYASAPQPKTKPAKPSSPSYNYYGVNPAKPSTGQAVSWQATLPWESATNYQTIAAPSPKPKSSQSGYGRKKPAPNLKPCAQEQYLPNPLSRSPSPAPQSYSHQYQQQGTQPGQQISWYSVNTQPDSY
ncbi:uncharacterized protein LOC117780220 [Drosophila innubila]|uniref:uncharacterized protein LOC117780220 n=1 Tax=Drosophila innubila TaxID=198719 RepID=UPI00148E4291|nr:uncharacterized protein LOC117780220 [Drosophila innubila]